MSRHGSQFELGWYTFKTRFKKLHKFCAGLASVFRETSTVESYFSLLQWEKNPSHRNPSHISLEGILKCKQHNRII